MAATPRVLPDLNRLDTASLRALILSQHEQLRKRRPRAVLFGAVNSLSEYLSYYRDRKRDAIER